MPSASWVTDANVALLVDQYELAMAQAYLREGLTEPAVFSLFVRELPPERNFLLACGVETVLEHLEALRFRPGAIDHLAGSGMYGPDFLEWLRDLRFHGDVYAVPEGTPVFAEEPILEVKASLPEAQLVETLIMNQVHLQTLLASAAARVRLAAGDRMVVDFGLRRMHGADAGLKSARAFHVAGIDATSNVLAGQVWGVPVSGTMAHSYIQAHSEEFKAFDAFAELYPETVLLVDTYDTVEGVRKVVELSEQLGDDFRVSGIRLDSGDLGELARTSRRILDQAGLERVSIFASGGLDEWKIRDLVRSGAPIDGFGVGTRMGVSSGAPSLDLAYKLTEYAGRGRVKLSPGKRLLPGRKQVTRVTVNDSSNGTHDILHEAGESPQGRPLLRSVMKGGRRVDSRRESLATARERARRELEALPDHLLELEPAHPRFEVKVSKGLLSLLEEAAEVRDPGSAP